MKDQMAGRGRYVPTVRTADGPVVLAPFVGASWRERGSRYWRRRTVATVVIFAGTLLAVVLTALIVARLARSGSTGVRLLAAVYALSAVPGAVAGRRWIARVPLRSRRSEDGFSGPMSIILFLFMPFLAGLGIAVVPALFGGAFPGERKARAMTDVLKARDAIAEQGRS